jgi:AraC-like DNA-binding protein
MFAPLCFRFLRHGMDKDKKHILNSELLKTFLQSRFNLWIICSSIVLFSSIFLFYSRYPGVSLFPGSNVAKYEFYTDSANGGNSTILYHTISDSTIEMGFVLKEGFLSPYVGISILNKNDSLFNLAPYNRLRLEIAGGQIRSVGVSIYAGNVYTNTKTSGKEICFYENIDIVPEKKQYDIHLDELKVAEWWYGVNNIPVDERIEPDFKHIYRLNIGPAYTSASQFKHSLQVYTIAFDRDNTFLIISLISAEFILILFLGGVQYVKARTALPITITYKAVDTENEHQQINTFLHYINTNFHDPGLTLKQVSAKTGINQRRIAGSIQQSFGCNFKTYINRLRINESKRLLVESELHIGEIAFKVGFSNQTHFNRVFKNFEGISPTEFLQNKQS